MEAFMNIKNKVFGFARRAKDTVTQPFMGVELAAPAVVHDLPLIRTTFARPMLAQVISGESQLDKSSIDKIIAHSMIRSRDTTYGVIAIIGPQSSGKSTLLNALYETNFQMMDAHDGRTQTTNGIWMAIARNRNRPPMIVLDIEGSDGIERDDDKAFERQSALFALGTADVILINMWYHDIGRKQAAGIETLETVFKEVLKIIDPRQSKTTILFVVRDYDPAADSPFDVLDNQLKEMIEKAWNSIPNQSILYDDVFQIEMKAMPKHKPVMEFRKEARLLRDYIYSLAAPRIQDPDRTQVSIFSTNLQVMWKEIQANRNLDIPSIKVLVAKFKCEEIAEIARTRFNNDEEWKGCTSGFTAITMTKLFDAFENALTKILRYYQEEAADYDEAVRSDTGKKLTSTILKEIVFPVYERICWRLSIHCFGKFDGFMNQIKTVRQFNENADRLKQSCLDEYDEQCTGRATQYATANQWNPLDGRTQLQNSLNREYAIHHNRIIAAEPAPPEEMTTGTKAYVGTVATLKIAYGVLKVVTTGNYYAGIAYISNQASTLINLFRNKPPPEVLHEDVVWEFDPPSDTTGRGPTISRLFGGMCNLITGMSTSQPEEVPLAVEG